MSLTPLVSPHYWGRDCAHHLAPESDGDVAPDFPHHFTSEDDGDPGSGACEQFQPQLVVLVNMSGLAGSAIGVGAQGLLLNA